MNNIFLKQLIFNESLFTILILIGYFFPTFPLLSLLFTIIAGVIIYYGIKKAIENNAIKHPVKFSINMVISFITLEIAGCLIALHIYLIPATILAILNTLSIVYFGALAFPLRG